MEVKQKIPRGDLNASGGFRVKGGDLQKALENMSKRYGFKHANAFGVIGILHA